MIMNNFKNFIIQEGKFEKDIKKGEIYSQDILDHFKKFPWKKKYYEQLFKEKNEKNFQNFVAKK